MCFKHELKIFEWSHAYDLSLLIRAVRKQRKGLSTCAVQAQTLKVEGTLLLSMAVNGRRSHSIVFRVRQRNLRSDSSTY